MTPVPRPDQRSSRPKHRGYTVVELMIALGVFALGMTGLAAMQKITSSSNRHAKNVALAAAIAQSWQDQLGIDALKWNQASGRINTTWVKAADSNNNQWIFPAQTADFGPAFDARGDFVDYTGAADRVVFCTHVRMTDLITTPGSGLVRAEVRVFWPKEGPRWNDGANYCDPSAAPATLSLPDNARKFHFVYNTTAVRQTGGL